MARIITFTWSATVEVRAGFDPEDTDQFGIAQANAWAQVQKGDGELTDDQEEPEDMEPA